MRDYPHVFEYPYSVVDDVPFDMKGHWGERFFKNDRPIVLELGCGRGEYTVGLGRLFPEKNFIGVDIKGARMWTGATESLQAGMTNVAFLRTQIEIIDRLAHLLRPADEEGHQAPDVHLLHGTLPPIPRGRRIGASQDGQ